MGALFDGTISNKRGLYLWNKDGVKLLLSLNDTSLDGSPVQEINAAACTNGGNIYATFRSANNPMIIVRLAPDPRIILQSGDQVPVAAPPMISGLIPGARTGVPLVLAGGQTGSIGRLNDMGGISAVVPIGARLPDGGYFLGSSLPLVRTTPDGRIFFAADNVGLTVTSSI